MSAQGQSPGPVTATGTASRNVDGQAIAISVFSAVKWYGRVWLPTLFFAARKFPQIHKTLDVLSFIHFARWTIVDDIPYNGPPQSQVKLNYPHMFFESNFNGGWEEYIDAFSHILASGMTAFWGSSYGFPKPLPTAPFKQYIKQQQIEASHYYSAYPESTTTMIHSALELDAKLAPLRRRAAQMSPEAFAAAYRHFLTEAQGCL